MSADTTDPRFAHLDDPAERDWLTKLTPSDVLRNAHRFYDFMRDQGIPVDSYTREMAFEKAATDANLSYDLFYDAWLSQTPIQSGDGK